MLGARGEQKGGFSLRPSGRLGAQKGFPIQRDLTRIIEIKPEMGNAEEKGDGYMGFGNDCDAKIQPEREGYEPKKSA